MNTRIDVDLFDSSTGDPICRVYWVAVPNVGERIDLYKGTYTVEKREWSTYSHADGSVIPDKQQVTLYLVPVS